MAQLVEALGYKVKGGGFDSNLTYSLSPRLSPGGKGGLCVRLTTLPLSCDDCLEIWEPQTSGTMRACPGL